MFTFDTRGYQFQNVLEATRKAAKASLVAMENEIFKLSRALDEYLEGDKFEGERDEDGHLLWERDDVLNHEIESAYDGLMELRKAFAIAAYHLWERVVQRWIIQENKTNDFGESSTPKKSPKRGYNYLVGAAKNFGYPVDPNLIRIKALANTLKHNDDNVGKELLALWPDIFPSKFQKPSKLSDWASAIQLTDQDLNDIFDIVSKSGPIAFVVYGKKDQ